MKRGPLQELTKKAVESVINFFLFLFLSNRELLKFAKLSISFFLFIKIANT